MAITETANLDICLQGLGNESGWSTQLMLSMLSNRSSIKFERRDGNGET